MTTITVSAVAEPKPGSKWRRIKSGEEWYSYDSGKLSLAKGKTYEVQTESTEKDGKTYYTITAAKEQASGGNGAAGGGDRWWMPFVSNTVAHAIQAGFITEPLMIKTWAAAAKQAALEIEQLAKRADDDLPSDVPF